jgi:hypothetical protein
MDQETDWDVGCRKTDTCGDVPDPQKVNEQGKYEPIDGEQGDVHYQVSWQGSGLRAGIRKCETAVKYVAERRADEKCADVSGHLGNAPYFVQQGKRAHRRDKAHQPDG